MKKVQASISIELPPCALYLDDILYIFKTIDGLSDRETTLRIDTETHTYEVTSSEEIEKAFEEITSIRRLRVECFSPHVSIGFNSSFSGIYISEDTPLQRGVLEKLASYIENRKAKLRWLYGSNWLPPALLFNSSFYLALSKNYIYLLPVVVFSALLFKLSIDLKAKYHTVFFCIKRSEESSFYKRNKDQLMLLIIGVVVGAVFTKLFT